MASDSSSGDTMSRDVQTNVENMSVDEDAKVAEGDERVDAEAVPGAEAPKEPKPSRDDYIPLVDDTEVDKLLNPEGVKFPEPLRKFAKEALDEIKQNMSTEPIRLGIKKGVLDMVSANIANKRCYNIPTDDDDSLEDLLSPKKITHTDAASSILVTRSGSMSVSKESPSKRTTRSKTKSSRKDSPSKRPECLIIGTAEKESQMNSLLGCSKTVGGLSPTVSTPVSDSSEDNNKFMKIALKYKTLDKHLDTKRISPYIARVDEIKERLSISLEGLSALIIIATNKAVEEEEISIAKSQTGSVEASPKVLNAELALAEKLLEFEKSAVELLRKCMISINEAYSYDILGSPTGVHYIDLKSEDKTLKQNIQRLQVEFEAEMRRHRIRSGDAVYAKLYIRKLLRIACCLVEKLQTEFEDYISIYKDGENEVNLKLA